MLVSSNVKAQEVEITDDMMYLRSDGAKGTMYFYPSGSVVLAGSSSSLFTTVVSSGSKKALRVLNDWSYPDAFAVYGDGTVEVNGVAVHSDSTLKEGITTMDNQMAKLKKLKGVTYHLKRDKARAGKKKKTHYGFLAQDVEKIYPDMVFTNDSGVKSIFYTELIPVLLEAVKAQQAEIESQNKQLLEIEKRLAKLEQKKSK